MICVIEISSFIHLPKNTKMSPFGGALLSSIPAHMLCYQYLLWYTQQDAHNTTALTRFPSQIVSKFKVINAR